MKKNNYKIDDEFYDPMDDLDESEVVYEGEGETPKDNHSEECYDYDEFISATVPGGHPETDKTNNNPWISAGVIITVIAFCVLMFWLFL